MTPERAQFCIRVAKLAAIAGIAIGSAYATARTKNASDDQDREALRTRVSIIERVQDERWKSLDERLARIEMGIDKLDRNQTEMLMRASRTAMK